VDVSAGRPELAARFDDLVSNGALVCPRTDRVISAHRVDEVVDALRELERATSAGSWAFGYLAYEAAAALDSGLATHEPAPDGPPLLWFGLCGEPEGAEALALPGRVEPGYRAQRWRPAWDPAQHRGRVQRVRAHIRAGDVYQCNLTMQLRSRVTGDLRALYADLATAQRGAHSAYLDTGRYVVLSASPELFFEWSGDRLVLRPMKGTARRGRTLAEDELLANRLRTSEKERAENVMTVDLVRNDVGRVARTGSVAVSALCALERFDTVFQMTSEVTARAPESLTLVELLRALFPCGSVTGTPKVRTMQLIRELEDGPRGVYCGAVGLLGPPWAATRARFNVAIRTMVIDRETGLASYGTGGGITWSSEPAAEYAEVVAKTAILHHRPAVFQLRETMAYHLGTGIRHRDRHLARLGRSAEYFGFAFDADEVGARLDALAKAPDPAMIRLALHRSGQATITLEPLPDAPDRPVQLVVDPEPIDSGEVWPYHKTSRREPYYRRRCRHPGADDILLVNEAGELTESTIANLAVRLGGQWWTPPVGSGCLPGIEREQLIERGILRERTLWPEDLGRADALALVSSVRGWRGATLLDPPGD
jgi:para-aminobenzoate synthetase/4-amino-4-deoxychorismate lyase